MGRGEVGGPQVTDTGRKGQSRFSPPPPEGAGRATPRPRHPTPTGPDALGAAEVKGSAREPRSPRERTRAQGPSRRRRPRTHKRSLHWSARFRSCRRKRRRVQSGPSPLSRLARGGPGSTGDRRARTAACTLTRRRPLPPREHGAVQGVLGSGCSLGLGRRPWTLCHPASAAGSLWFCVAGPSVRALEREEHS